MQYENVERHYDQRLRREALTEHSVAINIELSESLDHLFAVSAHVSAPHASMEGGEARGSG